MLTKELPFTVAIDDGDSPRDIIDALILAAFTTGEQPFAYNTRLSKVHKNAKLMPASGKLERATVDDDAKAHLVRGDGWTLRAVRWTGLSADLTVTATSDELAKRIMREATRNARDRRKDPEDAVTMGFWYQGGHGPQRYNRRITTPDWEVIRRNYTAPVAASFSKLMALSPDEVNGRILLLHGPPGTGKTTALRALAQAWTKWCQVDCVMDPENLFSIPGYLMSVAVGNDDNGRKWTLLLLEDCDELITHGAKQASGQALSRLLNLTDGLLAQGRNVLVGLTTNEPVGRLHPAVIRPGRCLAQIEVGKLTFAEASDWLGTSAGISPDGATLAELYALKSGDSLVEVAASAPPTGLYL